MLRQLGRMVPRTPTKPRQLDPLADAFLIELSRDTASAEIVLGGYFALKHYCDYRATHDVDAWWRTTAITAAEQAIGRAIDLVARREGYEVEHRSFGETQSWELRRPGERKTFSFQIAIRSQTLEPPTASPWPPIAIETLADNVAAKMQALVNRGAPRDFRDLHRLASEGLIIPAECWSLWLRKHPGHDLGEGQRKVHLHFAALEARRPLDTISDARERAAAAAVRDWTRQRLLSVSL